MKLDLQAYCEYFQMCVKNGPCVQIFGPFLAPNSAKIRPKASFSSILQKASTRFTWNLSFKLNGTTFKSV